MAGRKNLIPAWTGHSLWLFLSLLPPAGLAMLVCRDAVNVPFWDEWDADIAGIFIKSGTGLLTFSDLWAQHNESRLLLPRIFFLLLGKLTHWNVGCEMATTFLLAVVIATVIFRLERLTFAGGPRVRGPVFFISSLMIFSPAQSEAWLWGMELILYVPLVCILLSLVVHYSRAGLWSSCLAAMLLATVSTCTFSNGLLAWIVLFPVFFLTENGHGWATKKWPALAWLAGFCGNVLVYFHHYNFPPANGLLGKIWSDPLPLLNYFFTFLGGSLSALSWSRLDGSGANRLAIAAIIGGVLFLVFMLCCVGAFHWRKNRDLMKRLWPWLTLGGYGILSAGLATSARALAFGTEQALSPRYGIFGISLMIALVHLVPLLALHRQPDRTEKKTAVGLAMLGAIMAGFFLLVLPVQVSIMNYSRLSRLQAKSCLDFVRILPEQPAMTRTLFPHYLHLRPTAAALDQLGVFDRPLLTTNRLARLQAAGSANHVCGRIELFHQQSGSQFDVEGWATSPFHPGPADCVLLTCETSQTEPAVFTLMDQRSFRPDLVTQFHDPVFLLAGWQILCDFTNLPRGNVKIRAWAYDVKRRSVTPLESAINLQLK